jgi:hypothetical protein|tara:strand:- start:183 stop:431 length:249 start_codon:yes stop_codon:yes gene_type:complete
MNGFMVFIYFVCFAIIAGGAFALMWGNIQSINKMMDEPPKPRHPEAPKPGDEVMYVDVSRMNSQQFKDNRQRLEDLYKQNNE